MLKNYFTNRSISYRVSYRGRKSKITINQIELQITTDSTISNISLYSGEAEITRILKFHINSGLNKATIYGLSPSLRQDTLRYVIVEGQGRASINDVTVSKTTDPSKINDIPPDPLQSQRLEVQKALKSATQSRKMLSNYLAAVSPGNFSADELDKLLDNFVGLTEKADARVREAERQLGDIDDEIAMRPAKTSAENPFGRWQVSVLVDADEDAEVQLVLKYVVHGADWTPSYDIRVDTQKTTDNITIVYKALISQSTGENWRDTPLILETVTPSFGNPHTDLHTWSISVFKPQPTINVRRYSRSRSRSPRYQSPIIIQPPQQSLPMIYPQARRVGRRRSASSDLSSRGSPRRRSRSPIKYLDAPAAIPNSDKGSLSATFQVAGLVDIPSDGIQHHVAISTMKFNTKIQWYSIPKLDTRVYLTAKIKNETEYAFVKGKANVFVDGSFVASSTIPPVNPQETFDCPLGSDPAAKVTYHPQEKRASQAGIVSRSSKQSYTQRITIQNTKSISLENLKILGNIPVSQDERITVKLVSPALPQPTVLQNLQGVRKSIKVASGILAHWDKADDQDVEDSAVGKDGKLIWLLNIPPRQSVNVALQFEVSYPSGISLIGLNI
ncbi:hypothetical protein CPB83DRAFT_890667 [Crepidotus variabilis]|uniref:Protein F37C4.5 n=1 Tax=Crepidotus variabilis TaxID=179855 RepID=A0A9P6ENJ1_9AGAR|nr:hypothetical protein CPB83DRAFT_890667 [Crepidotus variabilis]